jgi:hypothetical protein
VAHDLQDFDIPGNFGFIKRKSQTSFKKLVKRKMKEHALNYLLELKVNHSKLDSPEYNNPKLQTI